jgi:hypothetical protein
MSPTKKRQTMGKVTRERDLKERRALKQEKKDAKKAAAAERAAGITSGADEQDREAEAGNAEAADAEPDAV